MSTASGVSVAVVAGGTGVVVGGDVVVGAGVVVGGPVVVGATVVAGGVVVGVDVSSSSVIQPFTSETSMTAAIKRLVHFHFSFIFLLHIRSILPFFIYYSMY
jgi:hypothetical protein